MIVLVDLRPGSGAARPGSGVATFFFVQEMADTKIITNNREIDFNTESFCIMGYPCVKSYIVLALVLEMKSKWIS